MNIPVTVENILVSCPGLAEKREDLVLYWGQQTEDDPPLQKLTSTMLSSPENTLIQIVVGLGGFKNPEAPFWQKTKRLRQAYKRKEHVFVSGLLFGARKKHLQYHFLGG